MAERIIGYVKGPQGDAATVSVGSTTTLPAGSQATVTNSGTSSAATFNFRIPKGDKGDPGTPGVSDYATDQAAGLVRLGDDFSINSSNGVLSLKNAFTKAASLAALVSQEAFATSMGKIAKAVDTVITIASDYLKSTDIVDSLTSTLATKALSAKRGKELKDGLDSLNDSLNGVYFKSTAITASTSISLTITNNSRIVMFSIAGQSNLRGQYIISATSSGAISIETVLSASSLSIIGNTNNITIQNSASVGTNIFFIVFMGSIS